MQQPIEMGGPSGFPFRLEDLKYYVIKRTDGTLFKTVIVRGGDTVTMDKVVTKSSPAPVTETTTRTSLSAYCHHTPLTSKPLFTSQDGKVALFVGDYEGAKDKCDDFDFVIDCGDVINLAWRRQKMMEGDEELIRALTPHLAETLIHTRILKLDWFDRKAPEVFPAFWSELAKMVYGDVMTCCVGGHGRSGTSFVCLLMNFAPDYDALDAIVHLRAVHCPRAIESKIQHDYINEVAKFLGRKPNAVDLDKVNNYKQRFKESTKPTAIRMREELGW